MNLCFVTREAPPNRMGGIGTYVANITELLAGQGHDVTLLTKWHPEAPGRGLEAPRTTAHGVRVYYLPFVTEDWGIDPEVVRPETLGLSLLDIASVFAWSVADAIEALMPRHAFDYIEAPEYEAPLSVFLNRRIGRPPEDGLHQIRCVIHLHSPSHLIFENNDDDTSSPWIRHRKCLELEAIRRADAILAPSAYLADQVAAETGLGKERFKIIPYPLGRPLPDHPSEATWPEGFHCLYVGRIEPRKGVFEWVEAACEVAREFPQTFFHFIGGAHMRETREKHGRSTKQILREFIPANLRERFLFYEHVPREELSAYYHRADCCVVPSRWDNFPNTCIEAMRFGKLVLASNQGGMAEMIEDGRSGLVAHCDYGDRHSLKEALRETLVRAIRMPARERAELGSAARARIGGLCHNEGVLAAHDAWRKSLRPQPPARTPPEAQRFHIAVFLTTPHRTDLVEATLRSIAEQSGAGIFPILVHNQHTHTGSIPAFARDWADLPANPDAAQHPVGYSKDVFPRLIERFGQDSDGFWCFLAPGMRIRKDFVNICRQSLRNRPDIGFCLPWIYSKDENKIIARSAVDENGILLHPHPADFFGVYRHRDLAATFDTTPNGYYLSDILRDCMLRLMDRQRRGFVVPRILADTDHPLDPCCLSNFCLHHPADSHFQLLAAHKTKLDLNHFLHHHTQSTHYRVASSEPINGGASVSAGSAPRPGRFLRKMRQFFNART